MVCTFTLKWLWTLFWVNWPYRHWERAACGFIKAHWHWVTVPWQMQCLQDQDALIPQPRGTLPKVCAAALAAITIGGIMFLSPERLFGWVAMVILTLTLGPLLHGLCLLAEEMLYHSNTRWERRCGQPWSETEYLCIWILKRKINLTLFFFVCNSFNIA